MRFSKKFIAAAVLLVLLSLAIPLEHKYDKLFRFFSLTLIPDGLAIPYCYDKKIYFFASDLISIALLGMALFWFRIPLRRFFLERSAFFLWIVFFCALISIGLSPFAHYPLPYIRLLQLLTPVLLFSFIANAFSGEEKEKITYLVLGAIVLTALFQTGIAIGQYFHQSSLGLRIFGEPQFVSGNFCGFGVVDGNRWIFDRFFHRVSVTNHLNRATGTFSHPNVLGGFLSFSLLALYPLTHRFEKLRPYVLLSIPFQFFALATTYSRSALFAWVLGTFIWFGLIAFKWGTKTFIKDRSIRSLGLTLFLSATVTFVLLHDQYLHRGGVFNYNEVSAGSDNARIVYQNIALKMIEKNPLFGVGYNQYSVRLPEYIPKDFNMVFVPTGTHNIYLFLATESGLISLFAFLLFILTLLRASLRGSINPLTASLLAIFTAFLFIGLCDFYPILFQQGKLMLFCVAGLLAAHANFEKRNSPRRDFMNEPTRREVWKMFDLISPTYDRINRILSLGMDQGWRKKCAKYLHSNKPLKILDMATGTGDQLLALFESGVSIQSATGIDLSQEMLQLAEKKLKTKPYGQKIRFLRADAEKIPFAASLFDVATFSFGIRNVTDPLVSLTEIHRILKPGGKCLILEFSLPPKPIRGVYLLYLRHILPRIGGFLSRKPEAYRYLNQTIETFPSGKEFCLLLRKAQFEKISAYPMALGAVTLYVGEKS